MLKLLIDLKPRGIRKQGPYLDACPRRTRTLYGTSLESHLRSERLLESGQLQSSAHLGSNHCHLVPWLNIASLAPSVLAFPLTPSRPLWSNPDQAHLPSERPCPINASLFSLASKAQPKLRSQVATLFLPTVLDAFLQGWLWCWRRQKNAHFAKAPQASLTISWRSGQGASSRWYCLPKKRNSQRSRTFLARCSNNFSQNRGTVRAEWGSFSLQPLAFVEALC